MKKTVLALSIAAAFGFSPWREFEPLVMGAARQRSLSWPYV